VRSWSEPEASRYNNEDRTREEHVGELMVEIGFKQVRVFGSSVILGCDLVRFAQVQRGAFVMVRY
jgi:hypothetical protein